MRIVIILPTYNERENVAALIPALHAEASRLPHDVQILVVDDDSPDGTAEAVRSRAAQLGDGSVHLLGGAKMGLGAAYARGMQYALGQLRADAVVEMDADLSHRVEDVPALIEGLEQGYDFVVGSRYVEKGRIVGAWSLPRRAQSRTANLVARLLAGVWSVRDCTAGFRAIRADLLRRIDWRRVTAAGYSFQVQLLSEAMRARAPVKEVPVQFADRLWGESKLGLSPGEALRFFADAAVIGWRRLVAGLPRAKAAPPRRPGRLPRRR